MGCAPSTASATNNNGDGCTTGTTTNPYIEYQDRSNNNNNNSTSNISSGNQKNNRKSASLSKKNNKNNKRNLQQQTLTITTATPTKIGNKNPSRQSSINSLASSEQTNQPPSLKDDDNNNNSTTDYSCGLFNFSIDFCHQCHQPRSTSSSSTSHGQKHGRNYKKNVGQSSSSSSSSKLPKQISASLTGLHSLVDQESTNYNNMDDNIHLQLDNCSTMTATETAAPTTIWDIGGSSGGIGVPTTITNKTSFSCSNVYSPGIGFGDKQAIVNISSLRFPPPTTKTTITTKQVPDFNNLDKMLTKNINNNPHYTLLYDDNNNTNQHEISQHCKSSLSPLVYYCKLCINESFKNFSENLREKEEKIKDNGLQESEIKRRGLQKNLNQISDFKDTSKTTIAGGDVTGISSSDGVGDSSKISDNNKNHLNHNHLNTTYSLSSLNNKFLNPKPQHCCRHRHLLELSSSSTSSSTKKSSKLTSSDHNNHHPNCCLHHIQVNPSDNNTFDSSSNAITTKMATNCFDLISDTTSKSMNNSRQTILDQTVNRKLSNQDVSVNNNDNRNTNSDNIHDPTITNDMAASIAADQTCIRFGRMNIEMRKPKLLLVFIKEDDSQSNTLRLAGERAGYIVTLTDSTEAAMNAYVEMQHELIIIDSRHSSSSISTKNVHFSSAQKKILLDVDHCSSNDEHKTVFRPDDLCKSIRNVKGSEFTTVIALVKSNFISENESGVHSILNLGFNRFFPETIHSNYYTNELIQLREFELNLQTKLKAASVLLTAIDNCKDGVVITGPNHDIRFANNSIEKMFGFRLEEMIGQKTQEYFQQDLVKADVDEKINNYNEGKEWEGSIYHRRKSGESVPIWNRILPINYHKGVPEYIIYIKEFPFSFIEKLMNPEKEFFSSNYGSLKGHRKVSVADLKHDGRRPSLAKFNSVSMIEAPITRVINMLMAIKEKAPNFLVPTLDKAIDILKNSEVFTPQLQRPDDQLTSELVCSLINTNKTSRRMSTQIPHEMISNKSSFLHLTQTLSTPPSYSHSNIPTTVPAEIKKLLENDLRWDFDVIELERISNKSPLVWLGLSIFDRFNVCETLKCSETIARNWLSVIESNYRNNPYHNSTHAADVMQATAYFLMSERLRTLLDQLDQAICLIAAIIHDVDHPGRNSAFLANSNHELALLYNDISVLESHHAAHGFKLTVGPNSDQINIFKNLDRETYREARQSIIDMVLATEMTKHFEHLSKFVNVFQAYNITEHDRVDTLMHSQSTEALDQASAAIASTSTATSQENLSTTSISDLATPENIVLIKRMLIKCADVSNPGRPTKLCESWANRIASEYCDQTEEEKRRCLPVVMPTFDRSHCSIPKSQIGFIDYFANDMFEAWHSFGDFPEMIKNMNINYQYWSEQLVIAESIQPKKFSSDQEIREVDEENNE